ncbi:MAG: hypothetical protein KC560_18900, partial [Myxococcales bacterium]|nr:hypothetical protein [Myxococcales bacterium]
PDDVALRYALGELLLERGRFDGALVELLRAERRGGSDARSNALLGLAYAGQQRHVRALHHLSEALRLGSDDPRVRAELVFLLATSRADDLRDPERALREAAPALEGAPTARLLDGVAAAYAAVGRRADADAAIARAIARAVADDDHVSAHEMEQRRARYRAGDTWLGPPVDPT